MLIVITGGAGSGKSEHAERLICAAAPDTRLYLATMEPNGAAAQARIARHRALRQGKGFATVERTVDLGGLSLPIRYQGILLEDLGNLVANELFAPTGAGQSVRAGWSSGGEDGTKAAAKKAMEETTEKTVEEAAVDAAADVVFTAVLSGLRHLQAQCDTLVVVTNEVFSDGLPYAPDTIRYIRTLGRLHCALCACADTVYESVCGLLLPCGASVPSAVLSSVLPSAPSSIPSSIPLEGENPS